MTTSWQPLRLLPDVLDIPPLLVMSAFRGTSYTIFITDLTYIWSESLEQQEILDKAAEGNCSIDPGESTEQMKILLGKLRAALQDNDGSATNTQIKVEGKHNLSLHIEVPLPKPLRSLQWRFLLRMDDAPSLSEHLLLPLLSSSLSDRHLLSSLLGHLHDKDQVIGRLVDKLDSAGVPVDMVFPGVAGQRERKAHIPWSKAGKHVRGLDAFMEDRWLSEMESHSNTQGSTKQIVDSLFATHTMPAIFGRPSPESHCSHTKWWTSLENESATSLAANTISGPLETVAVGNEVVPHYFAGKAPLTVPIASRVTAPEPVESTTIPMPAHKARSRLGKIGGKREDLKGPMHNQTSSGVAEKGELGGRMLPSGDTITLTRDDSDEDMKELFPSTDEKGKGPDRDPFRSQPAPSAPTPPPPASTAAQQQDTLSDIVQRQEKADERREHLRKQLEGEDRIARAKKKRRF